MQERTVWDIFDTGKEDAIILQGPLKKVLTLMGYDNIAALSKLSEDEFEEIEDLMRNTMDKLIDEKEKDSTYGIFSKAISSFKLLPGQRRTLLALAERAKSILERPVSTNRAGSSSSSRRSTTSAIGPKPSTSATPVTSSPDVSNEQQHLLETLSKYLKENCLYEAEDEDLNLGVSVARLDDGTMKASVVCPKCQKTVTFFKLGKRWNTSNLYKHLKTHVPKPVAPLRTLKDMFSACKGTAEERNAKDNGGNKNDGFSSETAGSSSGSRQQEVCEISDDEDNCSPAKVLRTENSTPPNPKNG